jgi:hypothetical protein
VDRAWHRQGADVLGGGAAVRRDLARRTRRHADRVAAETARGGALAGPDQPAGKHFATRYADDFAAATVLCDEVARQIELGSLPAEPVEDSTLPKVGRFEP